MQIDKFRDFGFGAGELYRAREAVRGMKKEKATVFLSFTSNLVASGLRDTIRELVKGKFVDAIITAGGAIDHDVARCKVKYSAGSFGENDTALHKKGINRLGNVLVPNSAYIYLEKVCRKVFGKVKGHISPSELISLLADECDSSSILYWAKKNNIPIFCPGITDSAIGLQCYFWKQSHKEFGIDVVADMGKLGSMVLDANKTGGIVLGGGISKHYLIASNILREGLDYAVYITTNTPFDGSLSGARAEEAVSWGKIKEKANYVTVYGDATILFPLLMEEWVR
ncbi:deoxyhypusine synthase [Candidatus Micrarchaeota archaeon CG11_big_fil_rev_8_21_14_0_20_47_5]|nr:MAG: deoxyhypusine synthase [Candidatus Micrarchaeota archaeon CG1_02_47_40]PIN83717.1 MAG: deoxyhypusine synthase [Candidatus Micrarchaeota archaeon CG11_big_fil_rev_8_21_14_0_20_47_5]